MRHEQVKHKVTSSTPVQEAGTRTWAWPCWRPPGAVWGGGSWPNADGGSRDILAALKVSEIYVTLSVVTVDHWSYTELDPAQAGDAGVGVDLLQDLGGTK